jgi:hypothetical protein
MIKYEIIRYSSDDYGGSLSKTKLIKKSELQEHLKKDWLLRKKIIPFITPFKDWWKTISFTNKIAIFAIVIPLFFGGLKWNIETYLNHEYHSLKKDYNSLNDEYYRLQEKCNDSITTLNERIETISQKLKTKKVSGQK